MLFRRPPHNMQWVLQRWSIYNSTIKFHQHTKIAIRFGGWTINSSYMCNLLFMLPINLKSPSVIKQKVSYYLLQQLVNSSEKKNWWKFGGLTKLSLFGRVMFFGRWTDHLLLSFHPNYIGVTKFVAWLKMLLSYYIDSTIYLLEP